MDGVISKRHRQAPRGRAPRVRLCPRLQYGEGHPSIKPLTGKDLSGVQEIRTDYDRDTYRAIYVLNLGERIFMLHVFQKKSKKGSETPKPDMDKIRSRLKQARTLAKELDDEQK